jgi:hypothetical protein
VNVYVATSSRPEYRRQAQHAMALLRLRGHVITFDWVSSIELIGHRAPTDQELRDGADRDVRAIDDADVMVAIVPTLDAFSEGLFFELGYARGTRTPVVLVTREPEPVRRHMFLRFATDVVGTVQAAVDAVDILGHDLGAVRGGGADASR